MPTLNLNDYIDIYYTYDACMFDAHTNTSVKDACVLKGYLRSQAHLRGLILIFLDIEKQNTLKIKKRCRYEVTVKNARVDVKKG